MDNGKAGVIAPMVNTESVAEEDKQIFSNEIVLDEDNNPIAFADGRPLTRQARRQFQREQKGK